eukprot:1989689-Alexandrium_andersonii.AAC.1
MRLWLEGQWIDRKPRGPSVWPPGAGLNRGVLHRLPVPQLFVLLRAILAATASSRAAPEGLQRR